MKHKFLLLYSWLIKTILFFFPDIPIIMRIRGLLYSFGMKKAGRNFQVAHDVVLNSMEGLEVGNNVYLAMGCIFFAGGGIILEDEVMFGPHCIVTAGKHSFNGVSYRKGEKSIPRPVKIGMGAWIAANCVIAGCPYFPKSSIAAAGSVLTKKFENNGRGIYGGIPATFIQKL